MDFKFLKKPQIRELFSALEVAVLGFILLNLTFIFDFLLQISLRQIILFVFRFDVFANITFIPSVMHFLFLGLIALISRLVFKSKLNLIIKSAYSLVPIAVVLVTIGMFFYRQPLVSNLLDGLFDIVVLYYLYRSKKPWLYYYALILINLALIITGLLGMDI